MNNTNLKLDPTLRVLVVDDYADERETMRMLLARGYIVETAEGGIAAVAARGPSGRTWC